MFIFDAAHLDCARIPIRYELLEQSFPIQTIIQESWVEEANGPQPHLRIFTYQRFGMNRFWAMSVGGVLGKVGSYKLKRVMEDMASACCEHAS